MMNSTTLDLNSFLVLERGSGPAGLAGALLASAGRGRCGVRCGLGFVRRAAECRWRGVGG